MITLRAKTNVLVGHPDHMNPLVATRCHGNLSEFMPFAILMMGLGVLLGLGSTWLHVAGVALIAGRLIQPFGLNAENSLLVPRVTGVLLSLVAILIPTFGILSGTLARLARLFSIRKIQTTERNTQCNISL